MEKEGKRMNKLGQVTVFIIIGILLVAGIILVFFFQNELGITTGVSTDPNPFIEKCARDSIEPMLSSIISTGGIYYTGTNKNEFLDLKGISVSLLCNTNETKTACTSTHPLAINEIEKLMTSTLKSKIDSCFNQYRNKFPNLELTLGILDFNVKLNKGFVFVKIRKQLTITADDNSAYFENFDININSNLFEFLSLANVIVNTESSCACQYSLSAGTQEPSSDPFATVIPGIVNCDADLSKLSLNYPYYNFYRETLNNSGQKIYTIGINEQYSSEKFSFAVINCLTDCSRIGGSCK